MLDHFGRGEKLVEVRAAVLLRQGDEAVEVAFVHQQRHGPLVLKQPRQELPACAFVLGLGVGEQQFAIAALDKFVHDAVVLDKRTEQTGLPGRVSVVLNEFQERVIVAAFEQGSHGLRIAKDSLQTQLPDRCIGVFPHHLDHEFDPLGLDQVVGNVGTGEEVGEDLTARADRQVARQRQHRLEVPILDQHALSLCVGKQEPQNVFADRAGGVVAGELQNPGGFVLVLEQRVRAMRLKQHDQCLCPPHGVLVRFDQLPKLRDGSFVVQRVDETCVVQQGLKELVPRGIVRFFFMLRP